MISDLRRCFAASSNCHATTSHKSAEIHGNGETHKLLHSNSVFFLLGHGEHFPFSVAMF